MAFTAMLKGPRNHYTDEKIGREHTNVKLLETLVNDLTADGGAESILAASDKAVSSWARFEYRLRTDLFVTPLELKNLLDKVDTYWTAKVRWRVPCHCLDCDTDHVTCVCRTRRDWTGRKRRRKLVHPLLRPLLLRPLLLRPLLLRPPLLRPPLLNPPLPHPLALTLALTLARPLARPLALTLARLLARSARTRARY